MIILIRGQNGKDTPFLVFNVLFGMLSARMRHPSKAAQFIIKRLFDLDFVIEILC